MVVAVTGGSGFVGSRLVEHHLERGDEVRVLTRRRRNLRGGHAFVADLRTASPEALVPFTDGADVIYHCAGELQNVSVMHEVHVKGTRALLAAAAGRVGRWVQLSSVGVYGPCAVGEITETAPHAPVGVYEVTKTLSDELVLAAHRAGQVRATLMRPSIIFGEDMPNDSLRSLARVVRAGLFFHVGVAGASANYVHVDDVVRALIACATESVAPGCVYNLSDWCTMEEFIGAIAVALRRKPPRVRVPLGMARTMGRVGDKLPRFPFTSARVAALSNRSRYPSGRIEQELGFRFAAPLQQHIRNVVERWAIP
jgi:nucleoside-diphosphate-sugar epimerase